MHRGYTWLANYQGQLVPMWQPELKDFEGPTYERIAAALERDIRSGALTPGMKLPTLKELGRQMGVTPGTVNRAYELANRRGLVEGGVGRGTFVLPKLQSEPPISVVQPDLQVSELIDLATVKPNLELQERYIRDALTEFATSDALSDILDYTPDGGLPVHRQAGAAWMQLGGFPARTEQVLLTAGAQHGLSVAVGALTRPGDWIFCESLCYPGVASVVLSLGRRIFGIGMDEEGMDPNDLHEQCRVRRPALVICVATCQNPTTAVMSPGRRRDIAQIARQFDFMLLDDDLYGFLAPRTVPPLATFAPERTVYMTSLSKSVGSSIRVGYMHCPPELLAQTAASVRTTIWMVSPLMAQLATNLITSGRAHEMALFQREEAQARQAIVRELFSKFEYSSKPNSFHFWLKLPDQWTSGDHFAAVARGHNLLIAGGSAFSMNRDQEGGRYIRISVMTSNRERIRFFLTKLAGLVNSPDSSWL